MIDDFSAYLNLVCRKVIFSVSTERVNINQIPFARFIMKRDSKLRILVVFVKNK